MCSFLFTQSGEYLHGSRAYGSVAQYAREDVTTEGGGRGEVRIYQGPETSTGHERSPKGRRLSSLRGNESRTESMRKRSPEIVVKRDRVRKNLGREGRGGGGGEGG
ncbi:uncharacterized protein BO97DRAFT_116424 [Aspergillus homomorphus CBS 101889]|uniref:Uncharacterized protein n=1 Tax=Aspergillus homomorphus (strain CBS 101889) TaxID=1450537 RepID=A0A395HVQ3_ASPHC|nr:hypothetical protein BO97DRAFT_116424 [Aspergillus homomorphus CBS 101889]RAL10918.1 hypothetical protein BO97DRAFT_116424 [Aspergillus homomorphus CBS 101889]